MATPRKVFRIEQMAVTRLGESAATQPPPQHADLMREIAGLRAMLAEADRYATGKRDAAAGSETARLTSELFRITGTDAAGRSNAQSAPMTRIAHELEAVVAGTEQATKKVLAAAEEIDQLSNNLSAALKGKLEQGIAQDIQDLVIRIFEACNFQDLVGQRVTKVMATLRVIEDHIASILDEFKNAQAGIKRDGAQHLHGPRLDVDAGHATQADIDALFNGKA